MAPAETTRTRRSADERRAEIIVLAIEQFAVGGYKGTSTEAIAREAGISQPYLFRLFGTKRDLFLACQAASDERIRATFRAAAASVPRAEALAAMGKAYVELLEDRTALLFQMQSYAACSDPVIQSEVRASYRDLVREVTELSGAEPAAVWQFFAHGMLLNVIASLDLRAIAGDDDWARDWCDPAELIALVLAGAAAA
jgi:AcrR family transcriptional regulator